MAKTKAKTDTITRTKLHADDLVLELHANGEAWISRGGLSIALTSWKEVEFVIAGLQHIRQQQSAGKLPR